VELKFPDHVRDRDWHYVALVHPHLDVVDLTSPATSPAAYPPLRSIRDSNGAEVGQLGEGARWFRTREQVEEYISSHPSGECLYAARVLMLFHPEDRQ
jgi:hypothetical protein